MDKNTIMDAMEHIDPKLIEDADHGVKSGRKVFKGSMLIAACVCLLLVTTALAERFFFPAPEVEYEKSKPHMVTGELGDSFRPVLKAPEADPVSTKVPLASFNEAFLSDVANKPEEENLLYYYFDDWSELEDYIGVNMWDNPVLDEAEHFFCTVGDRGQTHGYMFCTEMDDILTCARAFAFYHMNPTEVPSGYPGINNTVHVTVKVEAAVYTEHSPIPESDMFHGFFYEMGADFTDELYISPSGCEFRIVRAEIHDERDDIVNYYGYICLDNVYIMVQTHFNPDETVALETLKEVLDGFVVE